MWSDPFVISRINGFSLPPSFSWVTGKCERFNRFNGFLLFSHDTVRTVWRCLLLNFTQLKPGVNERTTMSLTPGNV